MTEWKLHHKIFTAAGAAAAAIVIYAGITADRMVRVGAGYKAKIACSEIFLAGRDPEAVLSGDFAGMPAVMDKIPVTVNLDAQTTRANGPLGLGRARALYRDGYGCTLANAGRIAMLPEPEPAIVAEPWEEAPPVSGRAILRIDYAALDIALNDAFESNTPSHRAVVVVVDGKLVGERYADGFDSRTPFLSWSMAKSVTATLVGAAALQGYLDINDAAPAPEWAGDEQKSKITWNDLLRMQSGLSFDEDYDNPRSDVNRMLFEKADAGVVAARKPAENAPADVWYYSSGTTNLIMRTLRQVLDANGVGIYAFAHNAVLEPIGAASVTLEPDATGTPVGSSFVYATARDWARLGQLYLQNGVWKGARILPDGWARYVKAPTAASNGEYGAQFWLNRGGQGRERYFPDVSEEMYFFAGHEGQYVFIIPDKRMVIVRTGMTRGRTAMPEVVPLVTAIYEAVGDAPANR